MIEADRQADYWINSFAPDLKRRVLEEQALGFVGRELVGNLGGFVTRAGLYASGYLVAVGLGLWDYTDQRGAAGQRLKVRRNLDPLAHNCSTCPSKANVYDDFATMLALCGGLPGDGSDECGPNCRCTLEVESAPGSGLFLAMSGTPLTGLLSWGRIR